MSVKREGWMGAREEWRTSKLIVDLSSRVRATAISNLEFSLRFTASKDGISKRTVHHQTNFLLNWVLFVSASHLRFSVSLEIAADTLSLCERNLMNGFWTHTLRNPWTLVLIVYRFVRCRTRGTWGEKSRFVRVCFSLALSSVVLFTCHWFVDLSYVIDWS